MNALADPLPLARALIRANSVTPADGGAMAALAAALAELGFATTGLPFGEDAGRPRIENLYARRGDAGFNFCFAGHTDVVPPGGGWTVDPFAAEVIDGHLYGRGAVDMKSAIACFVAAVARRGQGAGAISLLITGDEEARALDGTRRVLDWLAAKGEALSACLVGEPTSAATLGDTVKIGRRGSMTGRMVVRGTQGHTAYPQLADNPLPRLVRMLDALASTPLDEGNAHFQPSTLALTTIDVGNPANNVIPAEGRATFNIRFNSDHTSTALEARLRALLDQVGGDYEIAFEVSGESFLTPPGPLSDALSRAIRAVTGLTPDLNTLGGTSDARFIKDHCPVVEFGLVGRTMHKTDERVALSDLEALTEIYRRLLDEMLGAGT